VYLSELTLFWCFFVNSVNSVTPPTSSALFISAAAAAAAD